MGTINTRNGDDSIIADIAEENGCLPLYISINSGTIDTGNGNDSIIFQAGLSNGGGVFLGDGNDSLLADASPLYPALMNEDVIETGDGDDIITGNGVIYNQGVINTDNGKDSIIADGGFQGSGNLFLENGKDYLKGFGSGNFNGGNGNDTLELTSGSYSIGIMGAVVSFTKGSSVMITSEFEKLKAGDQIYDFSNFTPGQIINVYW